LKHDKTVVVMYFDSIGYEEVCPKIKAIRQKVVSELKAAPIAVYEFDKPGEMN
jgi:hypothetical protein